MSRHHISAIVIAVLITHLLPQIGNCVDPDSGGGTLNVTITDLNGIGRRSEDVECRIEVRDVDTGNVERVLMENQRFRTNKDGLLTVIPIDAYKAVRNNRVFVRFDPVDTSLETVVLENLSGGANHTVSIVMKVRSRPVPVEGPPQLVYHSRQGQFHLARMDGTAYYCPPGKPRGVLTAIEFDHSDKDYYYYRDKLNNSKRWAFERGHTAEAASHPRPNPRGDWRTVWTRDGSVPHAKWEPFTKAREITPDFME
ncbi:hypothetical protein Mal52_40800 [Symmachiella dynata]|uniref:Uncharacterized protein n=1 Tax=Symmachiella dynata TaxID=2527995 RepID=A0A517ZSY1_9PLAN|nr:hypothetical protein [Symmachiella dynata]QDU45586.1 hypothetical protein Mal52_40800 [Symmachiella dynata]